MGGEGHSLSTVATHLSMNLACVTASLPPLCQFTHVQAMQAADFCVGESCLDIKLASRTRLHCPAAACHCKKGALVLACSRSQFTQGSYELSCRSDQRSSCWSFQLSSPGSTLDQAQLLNCQARCFAQPLLSPVVVGAALGHSHLMSDPTNGHCPSWVAIVPRTWFVPRGRGESLHGQSKPTGSPFCFITTGLSTLMSKTQFCRVGPQQDLVNMGSTERVKEMV